MPRKVDHVRSIPVDLPPVPSPEGNLKYSVYFLRDTDPKDRLPKLDLHGTINPDETEQKIRTFVLQQRDKGEELCRIIHGVGTGMLKEKTAQILTVLVKEGVVSEFSDSQNSKYRLSAKLVVLKNKVG